ncbi:hypothetical protein BRPE64_DCDS09260 (plasmid) [Caballeronia insecticola]|uniref:Uncharacterized protein n=1 Tax=Caballeronia insecticola TaxID=758793 RepID=R4X533_9BURK|nr:hypothetical protein BRPE64_DCDS09260 [Caballeronia insecticola]
MSRPSSGSRKYRWKRVNRSIFSHICVRKIPSKRRFFGLPSRLKLTTMT